jgi:CheY-like chemotaxis protein
MSDTLCGDQPISAEPLRRDVAASSIRETGSVGPLAEVKCVGPSSGTLDQRSPAANDLDILNCRILVAEDGPYNRRLIVFLLRNEGAEVIVAENGRVAVDLALASQHAGSPFDAILMDMRMPVMDGYEATRELRIAEYRGPIIALTANAASEDRQKCLDAGCDEYMSKPFNPTKLVEVVKTWAGHEIRSGDPV